MAKAIQFKSYAFSLFLLALLTFAPSLHAVVLDWDTLSWTSGAMSQAYDIDSSNSNNGSTNDVFISITGNTNQFNVSPTINTNLTGGVSPVEKALFLNMNYTTTNQSITVSVGLNYSGGVSNLTFTLFDVDRLVAGSDSGYTDKITSIIGRGTNGLVVVPTITTNVGNSLFNGGTSNQFVRGISTINDTNSQGNVTFTFTTAITNFSFTYGNEANAPANPGNQWISLYDISFSPKPKVPEWHPALFATLLCFTVFFGRRFMS